MIGEGALVGYARKQIELARQDLRLERGHGAMVADFGVAIEEIERTRMMSILGLHELRKTYERERADFDAEGGDQQREHEVQVSWQRAELAGAEIANDYPALNAQALVSMNSALDGLVEEFAPAVRDMPFEATLQQAEEEVPAATDLLTPELREKMLKTIRTLFEVPEELEKVRGRGASRYERRLKQVGLGAPDDRTIPADLDQALREFIVIRNVLVHRAGRLTEKALKQAPSLRQSYKDGDLVRLSSEDYRTYSAAMRCYGAEVIHRLWRKTSTPVAPEEEVDLQNWRQDHLSGA